METPRTPACRILRKLVSTYVCWSMFDWIRELQMKPGAHTGLSNGEGGTICRLDPHMLMGPSRK